MIMSGEVYSAALKYFQSMSPGLNIRNFMDTSNSGTPLHTTATSHSWVILNGRRIPAGEGAASARSSYVEVQDAAGVTYLCLLEHIISISQDHVGHGLMFLARVHQQAADPGLWQGSIWYVRVCSFSTFKQVTLL